jgi:hypothetical protein
MTTRLPMICDSCIHRSPTDGTCTAFPQGIPLNPLKAERHDTRRPDQDNAVVYEFAPDRIRERDAFNRYAAALLNR